jgi:hypothetical protein
MILYAASSSHVPVYINPIANAATDYNSMVLPESNIIGDIASNSSIFALPA